MAPEVVQVGKRNNAYQHIEVLKRNREKRSKYQEFFVEGVQSISRLVRFGWPVKALVYAAGRPLSDWAKGILKDANARIHYAMAPELLAELSEKEEPSELLAVVPMPMEDPNRIRIHDQLLVVVFDRPSNHGNLGTIIRTCDALGADGLILTGHSADLYDPQTIRASVGSLFVLPAVRLPSQNELLPWLHRVRAQLPAFTLLGMDENGARAVEEVDLCGPCAFVLGNETDGMSRAYQTLCDELIRIPMGGSATSMNVACAASIVLYEMSRQRRAAR